jgi:DNA-binding CsgD family transcriptional regulator
LRADDPRVADRDERLRREAPLPEALADSCYREILDRLNVAVFVFSGGRVVYSNDSGGRLVTRLRRRYKVELSVLLGDQLARLGPVTGREHEPVVTLFTTERGESFHVHVIPLDERRVAISLRELGAELEAFRQRYGMSQREAQVAELVLHGYRNREIATALNITVETAKKHLSRIFDKVGVNSRLQLANRLA